MSAAYDQCFSFPSAWPQLQLALVFPHEGSQFISVAQQPRPLFVIERHRKPAEAVDAYASLVADPELRCSRFPGVNLLFQLRDPFEQLFFGRFRLCHGELLFCHDFG